MRVTKRERSQKFHHLQEARIIMFNTSKFGLFSMICLVEFDLRLIVVHLTVARIIHVVCSVKYTLIHVMGCVTMYILFVEEM